MGGRRENSKSISDSMNWIADKKVLTSFPPVSLLVTKSSQVGITWTFYIRSVEVEKCKIPYRWMTVGTYAQWSIQKHFSSSKWSVSIFRQNIQGPFCRRESFLDLRNILWTKDLAHVKRHYTRHRINKFQITKYRIFMSLQYRQRQNLTVRYYK